MAVHLTGTRTLLGQAAAALVCVLSLTLSATAATCDDLEAAKRTTYGFRPSQLSPSAKEAKTRALDAFWDRVKARGPAGLQCLRAMITADSSDGFFAFDAGTTIKQGQVFRAGITYFLPAELQPGTYYLVVDSSTREWSRGDGFYRLYVGFNEDLMGPLIPSP